MKRFLFPVADLTLTVSVPIPVTVQIPVTIPVPDPVAISIPVAVPVPVPIQIISSFKTITVRYLLHLIWSIHLGLFIRM